MKYASKANALKCFDTDFQNEYTQYSESQWHLEKKQLFCSYYYFIDILIVNFF